MPTDTVASRTSIKQLIVWLAIAVLALVIVVSFSAGFKVAHGNSDYVCSAGVSDSGQGACTDGSWSDWANVGGVLQRTYTGSRSSLSFSGSVNGVSCSHPAYTKEQAVGTYTTSYSACQIQQIGTDGSGSTGAGTTSGTNPSQASITVSSQSETTGAVSTSTQTSGSYTDYLNATDALLATSSIRAFPQLLHRGATTAITWTSSHTKSCVVTSTNGDTWPKSVTTTQTVTDADGNQVNQQVTTMPSALTGNEVSSPITGQTIYTLACMTALNRPIVTTVTVNIIPVFQEN